VDGQNVDVVRELVPHYAGVPVAEILNVIGVNLERFGLSGDRGVEFVVAEGFEGVV
jgi:hypothetical protein